MMKNLVILATTLAIFIPFNPTFAKNISFKEIAFVENIPKYLSTEGNLATLYKNPVGCKLEFVIYGELGKWQEVYHFKNNKLISAYTIQTDYAGLANAENKTVKADKSIKKVLNIKQPKTISDFNELKAEFPKEKLALCQ